MRPLLFLALAFATTTMPAALADAHGDCDSKGYPALGIVDIGGVAYVDDRNYLFGNGVWIYRESNGQPGLQRGGASWLSPDDNEICSDDSENGPDSFWT